MTATIYALSSGRPPAGIAVLRVSGPEARSAGIALAGSLPPPRTASLRRLRDAEDATLDHALVLFFDRPATATGEDIVEFHLHGGRAVVSAVEQALAALPGTRVAEPGEFTRRALENGRIDVAQAEGLADLLEAETEQQRRAALGSSEGVLSRAIRRWLDELALLAAQVEAQLDFSDEGDVAADQTVDAVAAVRRLLADIDRLLDAPDVERLRDGPVVVIAGPRNAGKSSLFNALLQREAAIVTPIAGTTRDVLEAAVMRDGQPYRLYDTAGLVASTDDEVEQIGVDRARMLMQQADLLLWLGSATDRPSGSVHIASKSDLGPPSEGVDLAVSSFDQGSIATLWELVSRKTQGAVSHGGEIALHQHQRTAIARARTELTSIATISADEILFAEHLRSAAKSLGGVIGVDATGEMLTALFSRFCIGK